MGIETFALSLGLPPGWHHVDPRNAADVRRLTDEVVDRLPSFVSPLSPVDERRNVESSAGLVREALGGAARRGASLYAWWSRPVPSGQRAEMVMAAAVLAVAGTSSAATSEQVANGLSFLAGGATERSDGSSGAITCSVFTLAGGSALRVRGTVGGPGAGYRPRPPQRFTQYLLPIVGSPALAVLTFSTTSVRFADALQPMFDCVASTLDVVRGSTAGRPAAARG
jgi:hypothetical protein